MSDLAAEIAECVARSLAAAPPLSDEQKARIAAIFAATPQRAARRLRAA